MSDDSILPNPRDGQPETSDGSPAADETKTLRVQNTTVTIDRETTVADLKDRVGVSDAQLAILRQGDDLTTLHDDERPYDHVTDGDRLAFRPAKKNPFG